MTRGFKESLIKRAGTGSQHCPGPPKNIKKTMITEPVSPKIGRFPLGRQVQPLPSRRQRPQVKSDEEHRSISRTLLEILGDRLVDQVVPFAKEQQDGDCVADGGVRGKVA